MYEKVKVDNDQDIAQLNLGDSIISPVVADLFYTAAKQISWILSTMTMNLMLSRLLIRCLGTSMTF